MGIKFANGGYATLASSITSSDTSITLTTGQGARFPSLAGGDYFYATLIDTSNNLEIVKCTARSTDVLTVTRAQESTTARAYSAGDRIELRITAAGMTDAAPVQSVAGRTGDVVLAASDIASGVFATARLASSGTASSSTFLRGDQSWQAISQKVLQTVQLYQSSTPVSVSSQAGTNLTADFYYPDSLKIGGTFTKQSGTSYLLVWGWYSAWWSSTNVHDFYMWCGTDYRHLGLDPYRMSGNRFHCAAFQCFTGVAAGSRSIYLAGGRGDSNVHTAVLNYNPQSYVNSDTTNTDTTSQLVVMEVEP